MLGLGVHPVTNVEVIDLGFVTRWWIIQAHGDARRWPQALWPVLAGVAIEARPADVQVLLIAKPLMQHAQPHGTDTFGEMLVVLGDGQAGVADPWLSRDLSDRCSSCALPANLIDASTAAHQPDSSTAMPGRRWGTKNGTHSPAVRVPTYACCTSRSAML